MHLISKLYRCLLYSHGPPHSVCFRTLSSSDQTTHTHRQKLGWQSNLFVHEMTETTLLLRLVVCFPEVLQPIEAGHSHSRDSLVASLCGAQDDEASPAKRRRVGSFWRAEILAQWRKGSKHDMNWTPPPRCSSLATIITALVGASHRSSIEPNSRSQLLSWSSLKQDSKIFKISGIQDASNKLFPSSRRLWQPRSGCEFSENMSQLAAFGSLWTEVWSANGFLEKKSSHQLERVDSEDFFVCTWLYAVGCWRLPGIVWGKQQAQSEPMYWEH